MPVQAAVELHRSWEGGMVLSMHTYVVPKTKSTNTTTPTNLVCFNLFIPTVLLFACFLVGVHVRAEASKPAAHFFRYIVAVDSPQFRDDLLVPMRFTGVGLRLGIGWQFEGARLLLRFKGGSGFSYLQERFGNPGALLPFWMQLEGYRRSFVRWDKITMYLGAAWRSRITHALLFSWDDAHLYYLAAHTIGPSASLEWPLPKHKKLVGTIHIPLFGMIGRPPTERFVKQEYPNAAHLFKNPHDHRALATFSNYRAAALDLTMEWKAKRSRIALGYEFDCEYTDFSKPVYNLSHRLVFTQDIALGGRP